MWQAYLFIHSPLIKTFVVTNAEVVTLAPSLHPLSPDSGLRQRNTQALMEKRHTGALVRNRQKKINKKKITLTYAARISEPSDSNLFKYRQLIRL